ncbi:CHC2 zinc finger domain-containing protein [Arcicella sp. LKC2W]|uniref:CHC2 zinc finger domain-containing protein n=1 Tax=Arcicella sp. LKC2W TaxID=2984198 RepID=UPI002B1F98FF|nr:CHC2 zinc finger domain-containing protein [Arcicella sp. LKC2W]MEA5459053.1 CHC2 zinc finger domain-containing protein [Arcicella sp. LKC2W]
MNILDELNQVSILQVAEDLGLEVQRHRMKCPFHEDDTPSLVLYPHTNSFYCFGCAKTGNSITLYSEIKHLDIKTTINEMASEYVVGFQKYKTNSYKSLPKINVLNVPEIRNIQAKEKPIAEIHSQIYEAFRDFCLQQKSNENSQKALEYLKHRGFTEKTIKDFRLFAIKDYTEVTWYLKQRFSYLDLQESGLYNIKNNLIFYAHSLIIPYYRGGRIVYLQGRVIGKPAEGTNRYCFLNNQPLTLFNSDSLLKVRMGETVYVTEGAFDCIRLVQEGKVAVSLGTANIFKKEWAKLFKRVNVVFYLDNDKAGHKAADELEKIFSHFNISCSRKNLPDEYKDVNDYYTGKLGSNEQLGLF